MNMLLAMIRDIGGPVVAILLVFSVVASSLILFKLFQFWSLRSSSNTSPENLLQLFANGDKNQLRLQSQQQKHPRIRLIAQAIEVLDHSCLDSDLLRQELFRRARLLIQPLESFLRPLEVIATLAPLLGLFGTVLGMIEAFKAMEAAGSQVDPAVLSGGIWQALLTTAVGLAVAIPVSLIHSALERKAETSASAMQNDLEFILTEFARQQFKQPQDIVQTLHTAQQVSAGS